MPVDVIFPSFFLRLVKFFISDLWVLLTLTVNLFVCHVLQMFSVFFLPHFDFILLLEVVNILVVKSDSSFPFQRCLT